MSRAPLLLKPMSATALALGLLLGGAGSAFAQSQVCQEGSKFITERKDLVEKINAAGKGNKGKLDPRMACSMFGKLVENGQTGLKWIEANKDWCQIPDQFATGFKEDHERILKIRTQACSVAAKQTELEKRARQQAQQGGNGGGLLGGPGLTGEYKIPKGAL